MRASQWMVPLTLMLMLAPGVVQAIEWPEANPGRPSFSSNATTTAQGALELETGIAVEKDAKQWVSTLKYGALERLDLRLNWGQDLVPDSETTLSVQIKWTLNDPEADLIFAVAPWAGIPTSSDSGYDFGSDFIAQWGVAGFEVDGNVIVDVAGGKGEDPSLELFAVTTLGHAIAGKLGGYLEAHAEIPTDGSTVGWVAAAGLGFALFPNLVLDTAIDVGLNDAVPEYMWQAGLTASMYLAPPAHRM